MVINISDILNEESAEKKFAGKVVFKDRVYRGEELIFPLPFDVKGTIINTKNDLHMMAYVKGSILLPCSRCTKPYNYKVDLNFTAKLSDTVDLDNDDPSVFLYRNNQVSIDEIVREYTILDIPIKHLCSENCRGLCPKCGTDLNLEKCDCDKDDDIDIRLLELKKLLPSKSGEV